MTLDDIRRGIDPEKDSLRAKGVTALYIFGSVAAGQSTKTSDVDIMIDYDAASGFNLFDLSGLQLDLSARFGVGDVVTRDGIHRRIRDRVLKEAVRVF